MKKAIAISVLMLGVGAAWLYYTRNASGNDEPSATQQPARDAATTTTSQASAPSAFTSASLDPLASLRQRTSLQQIAIELQLRNMKLSPTRNLKSLMDESDFIGDPRAHGRLLLWSMYCMSQFMYADQADSPSVFPMPLRIPDKVANAQLRALAE